MNKQHCSFIEVCEAAYQIVGLYQDDIHSTAKSILKMFPYFDSESEDIYYMLSRLDGSYGSAFK